jgi:hypothetical protein
LHAQEGRTEHIDRLGECLLEQPRLVLGTERENAAGTQTIWHYAELANVNVEGPEPCPHLTEECAWR